MATEAPPHHLPLRGKIEALLRWRQLLNRHGGEGRRRDRMGHGVRSFPATGGGQGRIYAAGHFVAPPPRRMRGSSIARSRSETKMPTTVSNARNMRKDPARY